jgi:diacylglycerol kinase (ATP)
MSPNHGGRGFRHLVRAFGYSLAGFRSALRHEAAFRQELVLVLVLVPAALWLGEGALEHALLVASLVLVLVTELLNSAVEAAVDRVGDDYHPLAGRAKDLGSAAVFMALLLAAVVWGLVALPHLTERLT